MDQKLKIKYLLIIDTPHRLLQKTTPEYTDPTPIWEKINTLLPLLVIILRKFIDMSYMQVHNLNSFLDH